MIDCQLIARKTKRRAEPAHCVELILPPGAAR
jgi:hypothetical protein